MRLLDLFCKAGGAAVGYARAGFEVIGVDIAPQPNYPFEFVQGDALDPGSWDAPVKYRPENCDVIHASPPCQSFTRAQHLRDAQGGQTKALDLLAPTRELLLAWGGPYVIENVPGAPLIDPVVLCGSSFGLGVRRHRLFESNVGPLTSPPCDHKGQGRPWGVYHVPNDNIPKGGRTARDLEHGKEVMGVDWDITWDELKEAIPPAYTYHLGLQLRAILAGVPVA